LKYIKKYKEFVNEDFFEDFLDLFNKSDEYDYTKRDEERKIAMKKKADEKAKYKKLRDTLKYLIQTKDVENIVLALEVSKGQGIELNLIFGTIFQGIDLSGQDLRGVDFSRINLKNANFSNANLQNCAFRLNNLEGANFSGANLENANFWQDSRDRSNKNKNINIIKNTNFSGCNLYKATLRGLFTTCNFKDAHLSEATLSRSYFKKCDFENADLLNADVDRCHFDACNFKDASLYGINNLKSVRSLDGSDFSGAEFISDDFAGLPKTKLKTVKNLKVK